MPDLMELLGGALGRDHDGGILDELARMLEREQAGVAQGERA